MLTYFPRPGEIVLCNYPLKALGAEMIKPRPCVIFSPRLRRSKIFSIVPLSTTKPNRWKTGTANYTFGKQCLDPFPTQILG